MELKGYPIHLYIIYTPTHAEQPDSKSLVRQHGLADEVADSKDVRDVGSHLDVHRDEATIRHRHAGFVGTDLLAVGGAAYDLQYQVVGLGSGGRAALLANG